VIASDEWPGWEVVGATANVRFFHVETGVLAALALSGTMDDGATARANRTFQEGYFRSKGHPGAVLVLLDGLVSQDKDARRVYQEMDGRLVVAAAMVATTLLGRAIASFSLGIREPTAPLRFFPAVDEALVWARGQLNASTVREEASP